MKKGLIFSLLGTFFITNLAIAQDDKKVKYFKRKEVKLSYHYLSLGGFYGANFQNNNVNNELENSFPGLGFNLKGVWFFRKNLGLVGDFSAGRLELQNTTKSTEMLANINYDRSKVSYNFISASAGLMYAYSPFQSFFVGFGGLVGFVSGFGGDYTAKLSLENEKYSFNRKSEFAGLKLASIVSLIYQPAGKIGFSLSVEPGLAFLQYQHADKFSSDVNSSIQNFKWAQAGILSTLNVNLSVHYYFIRTFEKVFKKN